MGKHLNYLKKSFPIIESSGPIFDYGKLYHSDTFFLSYRPKTISDAQAFMKSANEQQCYIRFRGSGHTFNGCTMPKEDEILIYTDQINHYRFESNSTLTVGAGAMVWDVRDLAREFGHDLKVYNGGWAGPSVGGFISAGGFGKGNLSKSNGGLWESINWIKLIDAFGKIHQIHREDALFPWLFGSYGQLGLIVEANFQLISKKPFFFYMTGVELKSLKLPLNAEGVIPMRQIDDPKKNLLPPEDSYSNILFWFSLLIDPKKELQAWKDIERWVVRNSSFIKPEGGWHGPLMNGEPIGYHYVIKYLNFHPPLVYSKSQDFLVIGVMSRLEVKQKKSISRILAIEKEFVELANRRNYGLYLQAENIGCNIDFQEYYGRTLYSKFLKIKEKFDPEHRVNHGVFFRSS